MKRYAVMLVGLLLVYGSAQASDEPILYGRPGGERRGFPIKSPDGYWCGYDSLYRAPLWVGYRLRDGDLGAEKKLTNDVPLFVDPQVKKASLSSPTPKDFEKSKVTALKLCPHEHLLGRGPTCEKSAFSLANVVVHQGNSASLKTWKQLEEYTEYWAKQYDDVWIMTGPVFEKPKPIQPDEDPKTRKKVPPITKYGKIAIPKAFYKTVARKDPEKGTLLVVSFMIPQDAGGDPSKYLTTVEAIEDATGLVFFRRLPEKEKRTKTIKAVMWPLPKKPTPGGKDDSSGSSDDNGGSKNSSNDKPANPEGKVWVRFDKGLYFHEGSKYFGKGRGQLMKEKTAIGLGFKKGGG